MRRIMVVFAALAVAGAAVAQVCADGACAARPVPRGCGAGCACGPCGCAAPRDCAAARPVPPPPGMGRHHPRRGPALTAEARAARLRARAAELERLADEIEAGREPAPPERVRRPLPSRRGGALPPPPEEAPAPAPEPAPEGGAPAAE